MGKAKQKKKTLGKPSALLWLLGYLFFLPFFKLRYRVKIDRGGLGRLRGPGLVLAPHTADADPFLVGLALYPRRPNFVVSAHFLANPKMRKLFSKLHVIPKRMFSSDPSTILNIGRAKREGNLVVLFPEGRLPCSGHSVPVTAGTDALVRRLGVDVYVVTCHGAYLSFPKWGTERRRDKIRVEVRRLFTAEEAATLPEQEVTDRLTAALSHNDEEAMPGVAYRCKNPAAGADGLLFRCPECDGEGTLSAAGEHITCTCGARVRLLPDYRLEGSRFPTLGSWFLWQRDAIDLDTPLTARVRIGTPDGEGYMNENAGEGEATLSREEFRFTGTVSGEPLDFSIPTEAIGGLPITVGKHFDVYYNNRLYYIYPLPDTRLSVKWVAYLDKLLLAPSRAVEAATVS